MLLMRVGERLIELREASGLSQYALAKAAGLPQTHLKQIEDGIIETPSVQTAERLRVALKASPAMFYAPKGESLFIEEPGPEVPPKLSSGVRKRVSRQ
jgi:transcriptional regulator with XRE-family HTH domain